jgi:hypothetical protein
VLKTNPHFEKNLDEKMKIMRDADKLQLSDEAYNDKDTMLALVANLRGKKEIKKIEDESPELYKKIIDTINNNSAGIDQVVTKLNAENTGRGDVLRDLLNKNVKSAPGGKIPYPEQGRKPRKNRGVTIVGDESQDEAEARQRMRQNLGNQGRGGRTPPSVRTISGGSGDLPPLFRSPSGLNPQQIRERIQFLRGQAGEAERSGNRDLRRDILTKEIPDLENELKLHATLNRPNDRDGESSSTLVTR